MRRPVGEVKEKNLDAIDLAFLSEEALNLVFADSSYLRVSIELEKV